MDKIVLASGNKGKVAEFEFLLKDVFSTVIPQSEFNVIDADETGLTFVENALIKARHACAVTGLPSLSDDSGLCINALDDAPGIYSARYAGPNATQNDRINKALTEMKNVPDGKRQASFHCVLALMRHETDPSPIIAHGIWPGEILHAPQGTDGFGYDPIFYVPDHQCSAAELTPEVKNKISHRGRAMTEFIAALRLS